MVLLCYYLSSSQWWCGFVFLTCVPCMYLVYISLQLHPRFGGKILGTTSTTESEDV